MSNSTVVPACPEARTKGGLRKPENGGKYNDNRAQWTLYTPLDRVHGSYVWKYFKVYDQDLHPETVGTVVCTLCHYIYHGAPTCTELSIRRNGLGGLEGHLKKFHPDIFEQERCIQVHNEKSRDEDFKRDYRDNVSMYRAVALRQQRAPCFLRRNLKRFVEPVTRNNNVLQVTVRPMTRQGSMNLFLVESSQSSLLPLRLIDACSVLVKTNSDASSCYLDLDATAFFDKYSEPPPDRANDVLLVVQFKPCDGETAGSACVVSNPDLEARWSDFEHVCQVLERRIGSYPDDTDVDCNYLCILEVKRALDPLHAADSIEAEAAEKAARSESPVHIVSQQEAVVEVKEIVVEEVTSDSVMVTPPLESPLLTVLASAAALIEASTVVADVAAAVVAVADSSVEVEEAIVHSGTADDPISLLDEETSKEAVVMDLVSEGDVCIEDGEKSVVETPSNMNAEGEAEEDEEDLYWDSFGYSNVCSKIFDAEKYRCTGIHPSDCVEEVSCDKSSWSVHELRRAFRSRYVPVTASSGSNTVVDSTCIVLTKDFHLPKHLEPSAVYHKAAVSAEDIQCELSLKWVSECSSLPDPTPVAENDSHQLVNALPVDNVGVDMVVESVECAANTLENLTSVAIGVSSNNTSGNQHTEEDYASGKRKREPNANLKYVNTEDFKRSRYASQNAYFNKDFYFGYLHDWHYQSPEGEFNIDETTVQSEHLLPLFLSNNKQNYLEQLSRNSSSSSGPNVVYFHYHFTSSDAELRDDGRVVFDTNDRDVLEVRKSVSCPWCNCCTSFENGQPFMKAGHAANAESYEALQLLLTHLKTCHSGFSFVCRMDQYNNIHIDVNKRQMQGTFNRMAPFCYLVGDKIPEDGIETETYRYPTRRLGSNSNNSIDSSEPLLNATQDPVYGQFEQYANPIGFVVQDSNALVGSDSENEIEAFESIDPYDEYYGHRPITTTTSSSSASSSSSRHNKKSRMSGEKHAHQKDKRITVISENSAFMEHRLLKNVKFNGNGLKSSSSSSSNGVHVSSAGSASSTTNGTSEHSSGRHTGRKKRQYYHSQTNHPIRKGELGYYSDDQLDTSYELSKQLKCLDEFTDVSKEEKKFMKLWNTHLNTFSPYGDSLMPVVCEAFIDNQWRTLVKKKLRYNLLLHFVNLHDFGLLTQKELDEYMSVFDAKRVAVLPIVNEK